MNTIRFFKMFIFSLLTVTYLNSCTLLGTPSSEGGSSGTSFDASIVGRTLYTTTKPTFSVSYAITGKYIDNGVEKNNTIAFSDQKKWKEGWYNSLPPIENITTMVYHVMITLGDVTVIGDDIDMSNPKNFYGIMYNQAGKPISKTYYKTMDYVNFLLNNKLNTSEYKGGKKISQFVKEKEMYAVLYFTGKDKVKYYLKAPSLRVDYLKVI